MPVTVDNPNPPKRPLSYPVLMISKEDYCIKLFVNETDGIILRKADRPGTSLADSIGAMAMWGKNSTSNGEPIPATHKYWTRFEGTITLGND